MRSVSSETSINILLLQAQTHARKASKANNPNAAIEEHDLAAGQFATAAKGTDNSEVKTAQLYSPVAKANIRLGISHPETPRATPREARSVAEVP